MSAMLRWCVYPLLVTMSFATFALGIAHLIFCMHFFVVIPGLIVGVVVMVSSFHGSFLRYPNRCHFVLQCICAPLCALLLAFSLLELYCNQHQYQSNPSLQRSVCYALNYRTASLIESCTNALDPIQSAIIRRFPALDRQSIQYFIASSQSILAALQLFITMSIAIYSGHETRVRIYAYHWQMPLSVLIIAFGCIHFVYCCTYFYIGMGMWCGLFIIVQLTITWRSRYRGTLARTLNVIGSAIGMALATANAFGLFCWLSASIANQQNHFAFRRHCQWRSDTYAHCYRQLEFVDPYDKWPKAIVDDEVAILQLIAYVGLLIGGIVQFALSLRSAFRRKIR